MEAQNYRDGSLNNNVSIKEKKIVLERLTSIPEAEAKLFKIFLYAIASLTVGIPRNMVSSTNF